MLYQTDQRLRLKTRDDECFLFAILKIFEEEAKHTFTPEEIEKLHDMLVKFKYIREDGWINNRGVEGIATTASGLTDKNVYIKRVGENIQYTHLIGKWVRPDDNDPDKELAHFVNMSLDKKTVTWDPYSIHGSRTVREGHINSYRYIFAEAL